MRGGGRRRGSRSSVRRLRCPAISMQLVCPSTATTRSFGSSGSAFYRGLGAWTEFGPFRKKVLGRDRSLVLRVLETLIVKGGRGPGSQEPWRRFSLNTSRRANNLNRASERGERERESLLRTILHIGGSCAPLHGDRLWITKRTLGAIA